MSHPHLAHAKRIVHTFKQSLSEEELSTFNTDHFAQLELLIEAAISTSVLYEVEHAMDKISSLVENLRQNAGKV